MKYSFVTLFSQARNVHMTKGIGLIPFMLHKQYGYDSYVASYGDEYEFPALSKVNGLKHLKIDNKEIKNNLVKKLLLHILGNDFQDCLNCIAFLKAKSKEIDILQIYHIHDNYVGLYAMFYKIYNPKGILYLKLDAGEKTYNNFMNIMTHKKSGNCRYKMRVLLLKKYVDIISVETEKFIAGFEKIFNKNILYIPCGCYEEDNEVKINGQRENIFLSVANLSLWKGTDLLLRAFAEIMNQCDWNLVLIGPIITPLDKEIERIFLEYPNLKERVTFKGNIEDKNELYKQYQKAKVFVLPSLGESFGTVYVEAKYNGCLIICTDKVAPARDLVKDEKDGIIIEVNNVDELKEALLKCTQRTDFSYSQYRRIHDDYCKNFSYGNTLNILYDEIAKIIRERETGIG